MLLRTPTLQVCTIGNDSFKGIFYTLTSDVFISFILTSFLLTSDKLTSNRLNSGIHEKLNWFSLAWALGVKVVVSDAMLIKLYNTFLDQICISRNLWHLLWSQLEKPFLIFLQYLCCHCPALSDWSSKWPLVLYPRSSKWLLVLYQGSLKGFSEGIRAFELIEASKVWLPCNLLDPIQVVKYIGIDTW